jgi:hypothetical protein
VSVLGRLRDLLVRWGAPPSLHPVLKKFEESISRIDENLNPGAQPAVVFAGRFASFDKGTCTYLNNLTKQMPDTYSLLLSEATDVKPASVGAKIDFDSIALYKAPVRKGYHKNRRVPLSPKDRALINGSSILQETVTNIKEKFPDMDKNYPEVLVCYLYRFYSRLIQILCARNASLLFVAWNQFAAMHQVLAHVCESENIPLVFMEFGILPGTFQFDTIGQMGESVPARRPEDFLALPVSDGELVKAENLLVHLKASRLNRNTQPKNTMLEHIGPLLDENKPVVTYFGQNDLEGGIVPYTEKARTQHSPIFRSSDEAAEYLISLAKKNNWNFIYKPHPAMLSHCQTEKLETAGAIIVDKGDINDLIDISDVVVTIFSQTAYISLIRETPTVLLGYTQLKDKGCTYQAFQEDAIEATINDALSYGYTANQKAAFIRHAAQLCKYCLFDDCIAKDGSWGQPIDKAAVTLCTRHNTNYKLQNKHCA